MHGKCRPGALGVEGCPTPPRRSAAPPPAILSVGRALPGNYADQETLTAALRAHWARQHFNADRLEELHRAVKVKGRHLALPLAEYPALDTFKKSNDAWIRVAEELGAEAVTAGPRRGRAPAGRRGPAGLRDRHRARHPVHRREAGEPARAAARREAGPGLRPGLRGRRGGAGAPLRSRCAGFPGEVGVLLSVELCSLTLQREDLSVANAVASGIFGDGAAAVVLAGGSRAGERRAGAPRVVATRAAFYPDTEWVMGWDFRDTGFQVVLSAEVPRITRENIGRDVDGFLASQGLRARRRRATGSPTPAAPRCSRPSSPRSGCPTGRSTAPGGRSRRWETSPRPRCSSCSATSSTSGEPRPGDRGLLVAMGPGFCAEMVLLQW